MASEEWVRNHDARRHTPQIVEHLMGLGDYQLKIRCRIDLGRRRSPGILGATDWLGERKRFDDARGTTSEELHLHSTWLPNGANHTDFATAIGNTSIGLATPEALDRSQD